MSLESKLDALTAAVVTLTAKIDGLSQSAVTTAAPVNPIPTMPPPVMAQTPPPGVGHQPTMPPPPTFPPVASPVAAPAAPAAPVAGAPFTDQKGLMDYVMTSYKALGPVKGARIQGILGQLGYANIGDVKPEHYAHLHAGVEQLKAQP